MSVTFFISLVPCQIHNRNGLKIQCLKMPWFYFFYGAKSLESLSKIDVKHMRGFYD
jgi:hypothetical protein